MRIVRVAAVPLLAVALAPAGDARAASPPEPFQLCRPEHHVPPEIPRIEAGVPPGSTILRADRAETSGPDILTMRGGFEAIREGRGLSADGARYDRSEARVEATGNVRFTQENLLIEGDRGEFYLERDSGEVSQARLRLYDRHARGEARHADILDRHVTVLRDARYTTCDPGEEDWVLRSSRVRLDRESGTGTARNVALTFKGVPVIYSPWLSFPIDDRRKSGFLYPDVGNSSRTGFELATPYYLNLHPRFDATLTPRLMTDRGLMLESEFRYLNPGSAGTLRASYLPDDDIASEDRSLISYRHAPRPAAGLTFDVDYNRVSDTAYLQDFGNDLGTASITHLEQRALATYQATNWAASARLQRYQTIDEAIAPARYPYRQLPALTFRSQLPEYNLRPNYRLLGTYVDFRHDERIDGRRIDLQPSLTLPLYTLAAYVQPTVTLRHTRYALDAAPGQPDRPARTLPVASLDAGVFLERDTSWMGRPMLHTLEPRLYYLYIPYRDQSDLPVFDTGLPDFNFTQLFRDNRFNGSDRVGDANQVSVAVVTRLLDAESGRERMRAGIGRIVYFEDREVTLSGEPETARVSDIVAEAKAALTPSVSMQLDLRYSESLEEIDRSRIAVDYRPARRQLIGLAYRFREETLKQTDVRILWPLGRRWHAVARHTYSLHDRRDLETLVGFEYRNCCWRARIAHRRHLDEVLAGDEPRYNRSLYLQLELIGLASLGDDLETLLDRGILGY